MKVAVIAPKPGMSGIKGLSSMRIWEKGGEGRKEGRKGGGEEGEQRDRRAANAVNGE
jgi:hypothetical protein